MKGLFFLLTGLLFPLSVAAQPGLNYSVSTPEPVPKARTVNVRDATGFDLAPQMTRIHRKPVAPAGNAQRAAAPVPSRPAEKSSKTSEGNLRPTIGQNFRGNGLGGVPNDNDLAVSDSGRIVSVINSDMGIYDTSGNELQEISLSALAMDIGNYFYTFDPRILFDPSAQRFVIVFLNGNLDSTNSVLVGFSQTADPQGDWNMYALPGNPQSNSTWSDFPTIGLNGEDLVIALNTFTNGSMNNSGFTESIFWQIDKSDGFNGDSLTTRLFSDITYKTDTLFNFCPVEGGSGPVGSGMYLLSNQLLSPSSDTLFVLQVDSNASADTAGLSLRVLTTSQPYGLPQPAKQSVPNKRLDTNDSRVQGAFIENGILHFVGNTSVPDHPHTGIYYGRVISPQTADTASLKYITGDLDDVGYPDIAYLGNDATDHSAGISLLNTSAFAEPGSGVAVVDNGGHPSRPRFIYRGFGNLDRMVDTLERWGDYTGIQRVYSEPGTAWMSGSYASVSDLNYTWISQIGAETNLNNAAQPMVDQPAVAPELYPNPASRHATLGFALPHTECIDVELTTLTGQHMAWLWRGKAKRGRHELRFRTSNLASGLYLVTLTHESGQRETRRVIVE